MIFTSDNGIWRSDFTSNAPLSGWKITVMESGFRVPCVMRWPGKIPAGKTCNEMALSMDFLPTFAHLANSKPPMDRIIDGKDLQSLMFDKPGAKTPHDVFYYFKLEYLKAVRAGKWKLHLSHEHWHDMTSRKNLNKDKLKLFNLDVDVAEKHNVAADNPDIVNRLLALAEKARKDLGDGDQSGENQRKAGLVVNPKPLLKN